MRDHVVQLLRGGKAALGAKIVAEVEPQHLSVKVALVIHKVGLDRHAVLLAHRRPHTDIRHAHARFAAGKVGARRVHAALRHEQVLLGDEVRRREQALCADAVAMAHRPLHREGMAEKGRRTRGVAFFKKRADMARGNGHAI